VQAEVLVETLPDTISEVVAKTFADTVTCLKAKAPFKKEAGTLARVEAYPCLNTLNEV